MLYTYN